MSRIELKHIDKFYGDNHVLRDINLVIEDGDFMTLLGPSGCGKTTTLRVVSGLEKPQGGVMTIDGVEMINADLAYYAEPSKRGLNLVFQSYALWPHMTVRENIAFGLKIKKLPKAEIDTRIKDALRMMRIEEYIDRYPNELSGGQQQRVAIARVLAMKPDLILMDEPTSALDPELVGEVLETIKQLAEEGHTMILVSHEMAFIRKVATRCIFLDHGKIVEDGTPKEVFTAPTQERTRDFLKKMSLLEEPDYVI
jgi:multiple sugar transport system ATP-binding protein